jgi:outer membrane lipopolysaccharide assembly protein LptE/RlpB
MKKVATYITGLTVVSLGLSGCGFHLRSSHEIPTALHQVYFDAVNPSNPTAFTLRQTLSALHIQLVDNPHQAKYSIQLGHPNMSNTAPTNNTGSTDTSTAYNVSYSLSASLAIIDNKSKQTVASTNLSASANQILNRSQILTAHTDNAISNTLSRSVADQAFLWLTTEKMRMALQQTQTRKK